MPTQTKTAKVTWKGTLQEGSGRITETGSGALGNLPVTWKARTEDQSATSPEELIAAAQAACFSMALSAGLARGGNPPEQLEVEARCTFDYGGEAGPHISTMAISVRGRVPGMDAAAFQQAAEGAGSGCPVSKALAGNVEITVQAQLA
jgi:lipoyl-dependent peroxiredoxin